MLRFVIPRIALRDLPPMIAVAVCGAMVAGVYGILHDQITYTISPEYFSKFKFDQFRYAEIGLPDRVFVAEIGFLATWWVGFFSAWFLARRLVPGATQAACVASNRDWIRERSRLRAAIGNDWIRLWFMAWSRRRLFFLGTVAGRPRHQT